MSETVVDAIVEQSILQQFIDTYLPVVSEAKIHCNEDGLAARAVDPANVAMTLAELDADAFESYESGAVTIGVALDTLDERLSVANSDDLVHLSVDMESRMLDVEVEHIDQEIALIDPKSIREEPDQPDLGLENTVTVEGSEFEQAVDVVEMVSDRLEITGDPEAEEVRLVGQGDTDQSVVTWGRDEVIDAQVLEPATSIYSMEYMADLVDPIPGDAEVTLTFDDEHPILIEWPASEGYQSTTQMLAPRIQSD